MQIGNLRGYNERPAFPFDRFKEETLLFTITNTTLLKQRANRRYDKLYNYAATFFCRMEPDRFCFLFSQDVKFGTYQVCAYAKLRAKLIPVTIWI